MVCSKCEDNPAIVSYLDVHGEFGNGICQSGVQHVIRLTTKYILQSILPPIKGSGGYARGIRPIYQLICPSAPNYTTDTQNQIETIIIYILQYLN